LVRIQPDRFRLLLLVIRHARPTLAEVPLAELSFGIAAQVLKALVGNVILETRQVEGKAKPQMVARFTINAVPALAVLDRGRPGETDGTSWPSACSKKPDGLAGEATPEEVVVPLNRKCHRALPITPPADAQPPQA
jgi:hypothetical protein